MKEATKDDFNPQTITLETFRTLLNHYPATLQAVRKHKAITKKRPKSKKQPQQEPEGDTASARDLTAEEKEDVEAFYELDEWRYTTLLDVVRERGYLEKGEMVKLMEWKLKHGVHRPALLGMIKSNSESLIQKTTTSAFTPSSTSTSTATTTRFPQEDLEILTKPLRGVGVATASLILSLHPSQSPHIPFYSDDVYLWLCLGVHPGVSDEERKKANKMIKPSGELSVKYNMKEYQDLFGAVGELRGRLDQGDSASGFVSCLDVERVAFVVRHYGLLMDGLDGGGEDKKRKRDDSTDGGDTEKKKKR